MRINGIGVVSKKEAMSILTKEGREEVKNGGITIEELGEMYKLEQVKKPARLESVVILLRPTTAASRTA